MTLSAHTSKELLKTKKGGQKMKKSLKIIALVLIIFLIIALKNNVFGFPLESYRPTQLTISDDSPYYTIAGTLLSIIRTIGIIVCVAALVIVGITMMYGSIEQKAEYKKKLLPIVIGAFFVVGTTSILKIIDNNIDYEKKKFEEEEEKTFEYFDGFTIETEKIFDPDYVDKLKEDANKFLTDEDVKFCKTVDNYVAKLEQLKTEYRNQYIGTRSKKYTNKGIANASLDLDKILYYLGQEIYLKEDLEIFEIEELPTTNYDLTYQEYIDKDVDYFQGKTIYFMNENELKIVKKLLDEYGLIVETILGAYSDFNIYDCFMLNEHETDYLRNLVEQGIEMKQSNKYSEIFKKDIKFFAEECDEEALVKHFLWLYSSPVGFAELQGGQISSEFFPAKYKNYMLFKIHFILVSKYDGYSYYDDTKAYSVYLEEVIEEIYAKFPEMEEFIENAYLDDRYVDEYGDMTENFWEDFIQKDF